jgi:hypothetical protein
MGLYRRKPILIEAFCWTGDQFQSEDPEWAGDALAAGVIQFENWGTPQVVMAIQTLEGKMTAQRGDWIIRGVKDELYPCKPDIFESLYEHAEQSPQQPAVDNMKYQTAPWAKTRFSRMSNLFNRRGPMDSPVRDAMLALRDNLNDELDQLSGREPEWIDAECLQAYVQMTGELLSRMGQLRIGKPKVTCR